MAHGKTDTMLTVDAVSKLLNVHPNTVRRWEASGVLRGFRIGPRGDRRFRRDDIERYLELARSTFQTTSMS